MPSYSTVIVTLPCLSSCVSLPFRY